VRVLFAAAELAPLAQTGGLGDAVAGLAAALAEREHELVCAMPAYRSALGDPARTFEPAEPAAVEQPDGALRGRWLAGRLGPGVELRLLDLPGLFEGEAIYGDGAGEAQRWIVFARAAAELAVGLGAEVLVAHDWHAALALASLRQRPGLRIAGVQVVHNGAHTGRFGPAEMARTGLPAALFQPEGVEFFGDLCLLKAGLVFAERIVAVSPSYARELATAEHGAGLEGVYRARGDRLVGIANGIDAARFDPARDPALPEPFSAERLEGRARCRTALLDELGLAAPRAGRLLAAIGRLGVQKGWDVLAQALDALVAGGASLALLGDGDATLAAALDAAAARHPKRVAFARGWNEPLARRLYAGADALLVPSRFEPCGLVQLLAQRYGSLPIAHRVGGLADTIADGETGVLFAPLAPHALASAVGRGAALLAGPDEAGMRRRLLSKDVSWAAPAARWEAVLADSAREARQRA
jgi:starch synthase